MAELLGELIEAGGFVRSWWTDRDYLSTAKRNAANVNNAASSLYIDVGLGDELLCVTVQRVPRMEPPDGDG